MKMSYMCEHALNELSYAPWGLLAISKGQERKEDQVICWQNYIPI